MGEMWCLLMGRVVVVLMMLLLVMKLVKRLVRRQRVMMVRDWYPQRCGLLLLLLRGRGDNLRSMLRGSRRNTGSRRDTLLR